MHNLPEKHQTLLFSATMPVEIETLTQVRAPAYFRLYLPLKA
jgi:superfamily II DNA/RNA helicase